MNQKLKYVINKEFDKSYGDLNFDNVYCSLYDNMSAKYLTYFIDCDIFINSNTCTLNKILTIKFLIDLTSTSHSSISIVDVIDHKRNEIKKIFSLENKQYSELFLEWFKSNESSKILFDKVFENYKNILWSVKNTNSSTTSLMNYLGYNTYETYSIDCRTYNFI